MKLTPATSLEDFHNHYWYLADLVNFCRRHSLDPSGRKLELQTRVEAFLRSGERTPSTRSRPARKTPGGGPITADTPVTQNFKCDATTRAFFKSLIGPHFHFTAHLQQFRRAHREPLTYADLAREWIAERERRKDRNYHATIERTGQYNQFVRDFLADKACNAGKSIRDAAQAWNQVRDHYGPHTYAEYLRIR